MVRHPFSVKKILIVLPIPFRKHLLHKNMASGSGDEPAENKYDHHY
jgi:hypothetical protein